MDSALALRNLASGLLGLYPSQSTGKMEGKLHSGGPRHPVGMNQPIKRGFYILLKCYMLPTYTSILFAVWIMDGATHFFQAEIGLKEGSLLKTIFQGVFRDT